MLYLDDKVLEVVLNWIKGFLGLKQDVDDANKMTVQQGTEILYESIVRSIQRVDAVASGQLMSSVTINSLEKTSDGWTAIVGSTAPYAPFVEDGRFPLNRFPPPDRIMQWMALKGMIPTKKGAYLIGRKIARYGILGREPFRKGIADAMPLLKDLGQTNIINEARKRGFYG